MVRPRPRATDLARSAALIDRRATFIDERDDAFFCQQRHSQIAAGLLLAFDGLEKGLEIALSEAE